MQNHSLRQRYSKCLKYMHGLEAHKNHVKWASDIRYSMTPTMHPSEIFEPDIIGMYGVPSIKPEIMYAMHFIRNDNGSVPPRPNLDHLFSFPPPKTDKDKHSDMMAMAVVDKSYGRAMEAHLERLNWVGKILDAQLELVRNKSLYNVKKIQYLKTRRTPGITRRRNGTIVWR